MAGNITLFSSAARAEATYNSDFNLPDEAVGAVLFLDITAESGTATLDVKLQAYDPVGAEYHDIAGAAFAQKSATGADMLVIYPGVTAAANAEVSQALPKNLRAVAVVGGTTVTMTFTLSATPLPA